MTEIVRRTSLTFQSGDSLPWLALAALAFVVLVVLGMRAVGSLPAGRATILRALRILLAAAVVLLALRPALRRESVAVSAAPVAVVIDTSSSMGLAAAGSGPTRLARIAGWLAARSAALDRLERDAAVDWFETSGGEVRATTREAALSGHLVASGTTDLAGSLEALAGRYPGRGRPPLVLLTDGADHGLLAAAFDAGQPLAGLVPAGGAILAVAPEAERLRNLSVEVLAHDPVGFLRTEVTARARVRAQGLDELEVPVSLLAGSSVLAVRSVRVGGAAGETAEVTFTLQPSVVGEALHRIVVPVQVGESLTDDNAAEFSVRVVRDRLRVLQVAGRPSWDGRFLRELLKRNPGIDLISFFILRNIWDDTAAEVEELSLIPFPVSELFTEKLEGFDLVIFQNFDLAPYDIARHLGALREHVEDRGGGLAIIGGDLAFGADYRTGALADVLPVDPARTSRWSGAAVKVAVTPAGAGHAVLRLAAEGDATSWVEHLLPVTGVNLGLEPRAGALVLLEADDARHSPLLVAGEVGRGRVLVMATDGTWRWSLPAAGHGGGPKGYEHFWDGAVRWLVRDPRTAPLVIEADRRSVGAGESAEVRVALRPYGRAELAGQEVAVTFRGPGGSAARVETVTTGEDGVARLAFEPDRPGFHEISANAADSVAGPIYVRHRGEGDELNDPRVRLDLLEALAAATDGSVQRLPDRGLDLRLPGQREERLEAATVFPLWRTWPAWALIAGLACVEWWLRRRWGLS